MYNKLNIPSSRIFNMDETVISTISNKIQKLLKVKRLLENQLLLKELNK